MNILCSVCSIDKPEEEFSWRVVNVKRQKRCKDCHKKYRRAHYLANKQKYVDKAKKWSAENGGKLYERYKLTEEQHSVMLAKYDGKCWSCQENEAKVVDHDHSCCPGSTSCGKCVRGLLCQGCNKGLGHFNDDAERLQKAIQYLYA